LFLTIIIMTIGILIGSQVENIRVDNLYSQLQKEDLEYQGINSQINYLNFLLDDIVQENKSEIKNSCELITGSYFLGLLKLDESMNRLEDYINEAKFNQDKYNILRDHYSNLQVNYYGLGKRLQKKCNINISIILYFYINDLEKCPMCKDQGSHLNYVKNIKKNAVLIFSFPVEENKDNIVEILRKSLDVRNENYPVLVINGQKFGFLENKEIFEILNKNK
jgi:nitrogen regulatory protein PII-like uncharacterized protein